MSKLRINSRRLRRMCSLIHAAMLMTMKPRDKTRPWFETKKREQYAKAIPIDSKFVHSNNDCYYPLIKLIISKGLLLIENGSCDLLKGHKRSLVRNFSYFCYGSAAILYYTSDVLMKFGRFQKNPAVRVFQYSHGENLFCSNNNSLNNCSDLACTGFSSVSLRWSRYIVPID